MPGLERFHILRTLYIYYTLEHAICTVYIHVRVYRACWFETRGSYQVYIIAPISVCVCVCGGGGGGGGGKEGYKM